MPNIKNEKLFSRSLLPILLFLDRLKQVDKAKTLITKAVILAGNGATMRSILDKMNLGSY
jgi:hypothetical protein